MVYTEQLVHVQQAYFWIFMITIDINAATPLFQQLVLQIKGVIKEGKLAPGAPLPAIRQLADDLDINAKTVAKAYKLLERDGVIESKGYRGTYVHSDALAKVDFDLSPIIIEELASCIHSLKSRGATDTELRNTFNQLLSGELQSNLPLQGGTHVGT